MRSRKNVVSIRMNDAEYEMLKAKVKEAGISQQSFIISAISGASIASADEVAVQKEISRSLSDLVRQIRGLAANVVQKEISRSLSDLVRQIRGLAANVNQLARTANRQGALPTLDSLAKIHEEIQNYRKDCEDIWLSIRSSINRQRATAR